jgi:hypothetical protein
MSNLKLSEFEKNKSNPFIEQALEKINENIVKRYKTASKTGERAVLKAVDENGEILGHTSFIRQIEVDEQQFTKLYLSNFSAFFDLSPASIKVFGYIMHQLKPKNDTFYFLIEECLEHTGYSSKTPIYKALAELVQAEIIARGSHEIIYFINPMIAFNGDRITFAKTYVKKRKVTSDPNQIDLFQNSTSTFDK